MRRSVRRYGRGWPLRRRRCELVSWLNAPYRQLLAQHQEGRGHHALLLHAIDGMGEESLVYALARWLLCQRPQEIRAVANAMPAA